MEVTALCSSDAEGLFHESVGLVLVAIGFAVVLLTAVARIGGFASASLATPKPVTSLALHLSVRQEAARHAASTPRLPVGPSPHPGFSLIPDEDRAGPNGLPLFLRQSPLYSRQQAQSASLEELDGLCGSPHNAIKRFHLSGCRLSSFVARCVEFQGLSRVKFGCGIKE